MPQLALPNHCTGCTACANSCAKQAISMRTNADGFLMPEVDANICVDCGVCVKKCPVIAPVKTEIVNQQAYAVISNEDRTTSSSGGAFSVFARWVLKQGGVVFGATMGKDLQVRHIAIASEEELPLLRGSKYVQSNLGNTYKEVQTALHEGKKVLYCGTGCQIAGLYSFLGKKFNLQLITLDLVCHGVPSQACFNAYLAKLKNTIGSNITNFRFRKFDSWDYRPAVELPESKWHLLELSDNAYMNAFFYGLTFRESCFSCQFCNTNRVGTFTLADYWGIGKAGKPFGKNVASGVSLVIDNEGLMPTLQDELSKYAYIEERFMEEAVKGQRNLSKPTERPQHRDKAVKLLLDPNTTLSEFCRQCGLPYKRTFAYVVKKSLKDAVYALGIYNIYKTISYKLGKI